MDMNPKVTAPEQTLFEQILPLQGKHIFLKSLGDGQINRITRKNDLSGVWVYFFTNSEGGYTERIDGNDFLAEIRD